MWVLFNPPVVLGLVLKYWYERKMEKLRFCIDLRRLNARTIKEAHSLPCIEETLDHLNGAEWFTSLDLKLEYWQVEMEEDSKSFNCFNGKTFRLL